MKKLIGKIFRDENGVETIEREPETVARFISKWELSREVEGDGYLLNVTCPKCKNLSRVRFPTLEGLEWIVDSLPERGWPIRNYCGRCGAHNIIPNEIAPF